MERENGQTFGGGRLLQNLHGDRILIMRSLLFRFRFAMRSMLLLLLFIPPEFGEVDGGEDAVAASNGVNELRLVEQLQHRMMHICEQQRAFFLFVPDFFEQRMQRIHGGEIDVIDRFKAEQQAPVLVRSLSSLLSFCEKHDNLSLDAILEKLAVAKEEHLVPAEYQHIASGLHLLHHTHKLVLLAVRHFAEPSMLDMHRRLIDEHEQTADHSDEHAIVDANQQRHSHRTAEHHEILLAVPPNLAHHGEVDEVEDADANNGAQHWLRQILEQRDEKRGDDNDADARHRRV
mmetsp:Transcript_42911/g.68846  ORF Transcript_42911/g.68846 Transcript_42911/m.68846 type:complete len:289 (-) Transcript_42911:1061-1927(-)